MEQTLQDYIRQDAKLRQFLLNQDGGIMKFWAEHPDRDFDVDLFDDYENDIVEAYLQANKQNRVIRSLPKDKLQDKALDWFHKSKGSEFKFVVALKSELNAIDAELYEKFLKEVDIYMTDAYEVRHHHRYPEGISPLDFYNEVIEKYGPFGLSLDCLERVLQEYRGKAVNTVTRRIFLTNIVHPGDTHEWEAVNNLQTEFDIKMFIKTFYGNGGYKKLRQAIKEILDKGTKNLNKDKCREICCKIAEDNMREVNPFTRWVNDESYPMEKGKDGELVPLITSEERVWLHNIMYENSPGAAGTKKLTDMDRYFCHFLSILEDIGKLWAAQLLVRDVDMKELEKKTGVIMNRHTGFHYYVDRLMAEQRGECFIYDWSEAERLLAKVKLTKESKVEEATQNENSDFELLKNWKDNPDLDYYLSEHWNHDVNHLLHLYLKNRYKGNEVGIYVNLVLLNGSSSYNIDYNQIYGVMFNEAYSFCSYVLNTEVPETKIRILEKNATELCHIRPAAPIISYNILVMTGLILCFSDVKNEAVGRFLNCLSNHNSTHYFGDEFHHFEDYIKVGLDIVAAIMIDSRLQPGKLRIGYDYKGRDEYLRKTIPWYRLCSEKYEKRIKEPKDKTALPKEIICAPSVTNNNNRKRGRGKQLKGVSHPPKYMTLKYVTNDDSKELVKRQHHRLEILFDKWKTPEVKQSDGGWGWLDASVDSGAFYKLFEGKEKKCNLKFKPDMVVLTRFLICLLVYKISDGKKKKRLIEKQTSQSAPQIIEAHFDAKAAYDYTRLNPIDFARIRESIHILDWTAPLPLMPGGGDKDYDLSDETLQLCSTNIDLGIKQDADVEQAVKSGVLRMSKRI